MPADPAAPTPSTSTCTGPWAIRLIGADGERCRGGPPPARPDRAAARPSARHRDRVRRPARRPTGRSGRSDATTRPSTDRRSCSCAGGSRHPSASRSRSTGSAVRAGSSPSGGSGRSRSSWPIVNLTALEHGLLPIHASAFVHEGLGDPRHRLGEGRQERGPAGVRGARGVVRRRRVGLPGRRRRPDGRSARADPAVGLAAPGDARRSRARVSRGQRARLASTRALGRDDRWAGRRAGRPADRGRTDAPPRPAVRRPPARRPGPAGPPVRRPGPGRRAPPLDRVVFVESVRRARRDGRADRRCRDRRGGWSTRSATNGSTSGPPTSSGATPSPTGRTRASRASSATLAERLDRALAGRPALVLRHPYPPDIPALADVLIDHLR